MSSLCHHCHLYHKIRLGSQIPPSHNDYLIIIILIIKDHRPGSRVPAGPFDAGVARIQAIASFAHQGFVGLYFDHDDDHHHRHHY